MLILFNTSSGRIVACIKYINCAIKNDFTNVIRPAMVNLRFLQDFIIFSHFINLLSQFSAISCICLSLLICMPRIFSVPLGLVFQFMSSISFFLNFQHPSQIASVLFLFNFSPDIPENSVISFMLSCIDFSSPSVSVLSYYTGGQSDQGALEPLTQGTI